MAKEGRGSVAPELGTALGEGYELVRYLGAGGTGAVYEALRADGRRVAVKVLFGVEPAAPGSEILGRYRREVSVLATLESPHIVPVIDAGLDARRGLPFLVMPLLLGLDVLELVRRVGALHPTLAVRIARQACRALEAAHGAGVVHRDIKPANLFLDHDRDGRVTVRLLDFGVAKWRADNIDITQTGTLLGTPRYMAPEQMQGAKQVDARADLWGLGATLYHALSGAVPYADAATVAEVCIAVMTRDLPALQERAPWIDPALAAVVHGALLRDREARCPSATALHDALGPLTAGSDELGAGMLHGAPAELRVRRAPRAGLLSSWRQTEPSRAPDTVPEAAADPLLGRSVAGRYTLLRRLGGGGMGAVYEAEDEGGRRFAVKVLDPQRVGTGAVALARFVREARALTSIASEHVVRVIEVGTDPGAEMPYIVMERLQGLDLGVVIERQGPLAPCTAARLLGQAARGLGTAHRLGLVHRDIKPANLFLHELPSGQIAVKICDFGIVKRIRATDDEETTAQLTRAGGVVGSPAYMSPEQAKDARDIDVRTDVWSLGVSLFRALSGTLPWAGRDSVGELIVAICTEPLPHLQDLAPWVPAGLAEIVHRAMRRDPAERFQSMDELARALEPFTAGRIEVEAAEIAPLAVELRAQVPARAAPPEGATGSGETESRAAASMPVPAATRRRRGTLVATVAGAVAIAAVAWILRPWPPAAERAVGSAPAASPGTSARSKPGKPDGGRPPARRVRVQVVPSGAAVTVGGKPAQAPGGFLLLEGEPGDSFLVVAKDGTRKAEAKVIITKDGEPSLPAIEVPRAWSELRRPGSGKAEPGPEPPGTPSAPAAAAVPTATAGPSAAKPQAKEEW